MVYIGFDFDQTLGDFQSLFAIFPTKQSPFYKEIVEIFAEKEMSKRPFKVIDPRIVKILPSLKVLKDTGRIKAIVIYSNNSSKELIEFIGDVLGYIVKDPQFIDKVAHLDYPGRKSHDKTVDFLKHLIHEAKGIPVSRIKTEELYFIDDQLHPDLIRKLKERYRKVDSYVSPATHDQVKTFIERKLVEKIRTLTP